MMHEFQNYTVLQSDVAVLEDSLAVLYKAKCTMALQSGNSTSGFLPNTNGDIWVHTKTYI